MCWRAGLFATALASLHAAGAQSTQPAAGSWSGVRAIQQGTGVRISSRRRPTVCSFVSADEDSLTCVRTQTVFFVPVTHRLIYPRSEVSAVKLSRRALSTLAGGGIGAAVGAGIGAGVDAGSSREDGYLGTFFFTLLGGALGAGVGSVSDFVAGPTIYRTP